MSLLVLCCRLRCSRKDRQDSHCTNETVVLWLKRSMWKKAKSGSISTRSLAAGSLLLSILILLLLLTTSRHKFYPPKPPSVKTGTSGWGLNCLNVTPSLSPQVPLLASTAVAGCRPGAEPREQGGLVGCSGGAGPTELSRGTKRDSGDLGSAATELQLGQVSGDSRKIYLNPKLENPEIVVISRNPADPQDLPTPKGPPRALKPN